MKITIGGKQTIFSASGKVDYPYKESACFGSDKFYLYEGEQKYKITFLTDKSGGSNYCPFTLEEVKRHVSQLDLIVSDEWSWSLDKIEESKFKAYKSIDIYLTITGSNKWHRFSLMWIRLLYEHPFQYIMWDAYQLKDKVFPEEDVLYLYTLAINVLGSRGNTNHTFFNRFCPTPIPTTKVLERLKELKDEPSRWNCGFDPKKTESLQKIWDSEPTIHAGELPEEELESETWKDRFEFRISYYRKEYDKLKSAPGKQL